MSGGKKRGRGKKKTPQKKAVERAAAREKAKLAIPEPPKPGPFTVEMVPLVIQAVADGWTAREIAGALFVDADDLKTWLAIYDATRQKLTPIGSGEIVPSGFSPIEEVRRIAARETTPTSTKLAALKLLLQQSDATTRIDWTAIRAEDIPPEYRPYLAGILAEEITGDVDDEFLDAGQAERDLFMIIGVLMDSSAEAQEMLDEYRIFVESLRVKAKERQARRRLRAPTIRYAASYHGPFIDVDGGLE